MKLLLVNIMKPFKNYEELWGYFVDYLDLNTLERIVSYMKPNIRHTNDPRFGRAYELLVELIEILEHVNDNIENARENDLGFDERAFHNNPNEDNDIEDYEINDLRNRYPSK